ncbi:hypothetical protein RMCBS344292_00258 [Rhizopus microsporus]|nr:hypothetical protein RMCBS344292_00258 [Rhizopus microsporus]
MLRNQYAISRYISIINSRHLAMNQERLQTELDLLKKSKDFKLYWIERTRKRVRINVDSECMEYAHDAAERAIRALSSATSASSTSHHTTAIPTANDSAGTAAETTVTITEDAENLVPLTPWVYKGVDVAELLAKFQQTV